MSAKNPASVGLEGWDDGKGCAVVGSCEDRKRAQKKKENMKKQSTL